jgi:hypothetical protein
MDNLLNKILASRSTRLSRPLSGRNKLIEQEFYRNKKALQSKAFLLVLTLRGILQDPHP